MSPLNQNQSGRKRPRGRQPSKPPTRPPASQRPSSLVKARRGAWRKISQLMGVASPQPRDLKSLRMRPIQPEPQKTRLKPVPDRPPVQGKKKPVRRWRRVSPLVYIARLAIFGVGIGAIAGTLLASWNPTGRKAIEQPTATDRATSAAVVANPPKATRSGREIVALKTQINTLAAKYPQLRPQVYLVDLDSNNYVNVEGDISISAASTIKVPLLVALLQDVDAKKVSLDETIALSPDAIGGGSGVIQYQKVGSKFTILELATKTIAISDNTATNLLIKRLGGVQKLNSRFQSWGLSATVLKNPLPDLKGTNTTTPKDLVQLMAMVSRGELISMQSRDRLLGIMRQTVTNSLLPQGLGKGATISHKTGDIGSVVGDVGLIDLPNGKRYLVGAIVKRPHNNPQAQELIRQISRATYNYFSGSAAKSKVSNPSSVVVPPTESVPAND
jgi:beta-lactamase class A